MCMSVFVRKQAAYCRTIACAEIAYSIKFIPSLISYIYPFSNESQLCGCVTKMHSASVLIAAADYFLSITVNGFMNLFCLSYFLFIYFKECKYILKCFKFASKYHANGWNSASFE